ncbi:MULTISPECIES: phosphonate C-P lyase system protein PhnH [unclassified Minwuia]|jgi:alpha-D-ribose 1-methylphosphonate 5-triphosphate synthase subunit PhnH|uniref:phosphonate C-P lyase system protein PhnH n=1 Tax=unclassified Minwuia TaxID=2618799 RepID=UPI0024784DD9|nr:MULTISPECIES: phosphonate C-P lyase system protein PhnH [unclassified Minwuia]
MAETDFLSGGLADPVIAGQSAFRAIMQAMAEPGTIQAITDCPTPPKGLRRTMASIATTLCDADTPIWLDPELAGNPLVVKWLAFHTGAPVTADSAAAMFAFVSDPSSMPALDRFAKGTDAYPDRSTTLVLAVDGFDRGTPLSLTGPGIEHLRRFTFAPMPEAFIDQWSGNRALFPRGVDLILAGPEAVACLPRSTRIGKGED